MNIENSLIDKIFREGYHAHYVFTLPVFSKPINSQEYIDYIESSAKIKVINFSSSLDFIAHEMHIDLEYRNVVRADMKMINNRITATFEEGLHKTIPTISKGSVEIDWIKGIITIIEDQVTCGCNECSTSSFSKVIKQLE